MLYGKYLTGVPVDRAAGCRIAVALQRLCAQCRKRRSASWNRSDSPADSPRTTSFSAGWRPLSVCAASR